MMKKNVFVLLFVIITIIIGIATPAFAERLKYTGIARSTGGAVLGSATVTIYLAGTTTAANVYEASSGGDSVTSVISDSNGRWTFYADVADYAFTQEYKVVVTKDGYSTITLDNIFNLSLPTNAVGVLTNDGSGNYTWSASSFSESGDYSPTGTWDWSGATVSGLNATGLKLADDSTLTLPSAASGYTGGLLSCDTDGTCDWTDPSGITGSYVPLSTFTAAGDVPVGSASGAVTVIAKGNNNTFFGVNNAGTLGFHSSFNPVLVAAPSSDDTYSGTVASFTAGEALDQWDVVYCKNKSGVHACYKYDANGADKALPPRAMAVADIDAGDSGTFLLTGIVRNDGWTHSTGEEAIENMSTDSAEGKIVYADGATAGRMTLTKSTTSADMVAIIGYVIEQNVIYFNPSPILVEVP
jgi:hypothetical protein